MPYSNCEDHCESEREARDRDRRARVSHPAQRACIRWGAGIAIGAVLVAVVVAALIPACDNYVSRDKGKTVPWPRNW